MMSCRLELNGTGIVAAGESGGSGAILGIFGGLDADDAILGVQV
jgi:hypothetical protein